jgi:hypothetical protein
MWDFLVEQAAPFMAAAARRYGREVLVGDDSRAVPDDRESAGRRLLQLVFGSGGAARTSRRWLPGLSRIRAVSSCWPAWLPMLMRFSSPIRARPRRPRG